LFGGAGAAVCGLVGEGDGDGGEDGGEDSGERADEGAGESGFGPDFTGHCGPIIGFIPGGNLPFGPGGAAWTGCTVLLIDSGFDFSL
jgi:hypothetical protein